MPSMLNENFRDILKCFADASVLHMVVGGYAMAAHGCPRATGDIDIWVSPDEDNARRVWDALMVFGAPLRNVTLEDFSTEKIVYQVGIPPQRIDILTSMSGIAFAAAYPSRLEVEIDDLHVPVIGLTQLMTNKRATGREKDRLDADLLRRRHQ